MRLASCGGVRLGGAGIEHTASAEWNQARHRAYSHRFFALEGGNETTGHQTCQVCTACFRAGVQGIALNAAYTSVIGAVNEAPHQDISVHKGEAKTSPAKEWASPNARPCAMAARHLRSTREESVEARVVVLVGGAHEARSGAGRALSVGRSAAPLSLTTRPMALPIRIGAIPVRAPLSTLCGILGDAPWPMDRSSMDSGTVSTSSLAQRRSRPRGDPVSPNSRRRSGPIQ